jgi:tight adherence protein C
MSAAGALVGTMAAGGVLLATSGALARSTPSLADRIAPYLDGPSASTVARDDAGVRVDASTLERLMAPALRSAAARLHALLGGGELLAQRLLAAGRYGTTPEAFRLEQVSWAAGALAAVGAVLVLLTVSGRPVRPVAALVLALTAAVGAVLLCDRRLSSTAARRREAIRAGLPTVADLLALAVASGESPAAALDRVARVAHGPLADECRRACADTASGVTFVDALDAMATRVDVPAVRRFVDGLAIAVQRGTPLADVLRAQAGDARADLHRVLLEVAGKKELLMLVPVVFLILPTVVLVALFPAFSSLSTLTP